MFSLYNRLKTCIYWFFFFPSPCDVFNTMKFIIVCNFQSGTSMCSLISTAPFCFLSIFGLCWFYFFAVTVQPTIIYHHLSGILPERRYLMWYVCRVSLCVCARVCMHTLACDKKTKEKNQPLYIPLTHVVFPPHCSDEPISDDLLIAFYKSRRKRI